MFVHSAAPVYLRAIGPRPSGSPPSSGSLWGYLSDRWPDSDRPSSRWLAVKSVVIVCNRNRIIDRSPFRPPNPCTLPASRASLRCRLIKKSLNPCRNYTGKYIPCTLYSKFSTPLSYSRDYVSSPKCSSSTFDLRSIFNRRYMRKKREKNIGFE